MRSPRSTDTVCGRSRSTRLLVAAAWRLSFFVRFDNDTPVYYLRYEDWDVIALVVGIMLPVFIAFGFYNRWWRYVSTSDMWEAVRGVVVAVIATFLVFAVLDFHPAKVPRGIWIVDTLLLLAFITGSRFLARTLIERPSKGALVARGKEVIVVGAGDAAQLDRPRDAQEPGVSATRRSGSSTTIRARRTSAPRHPRARDDRRSPPPPPGAPPGRAPDRDAVRGGRRARADRRGRARRAHPGEDAAGAPRADRRRLQPRRPAAPGRGGGPPRPRVGRRRTSTRSPATSKEEVVLVTGAGGSIGAELCRQIARIGPTRLVLVDNGEPGLFEIERELVDERGFRATAAILADVGNETKMRQVFDKYRPGVVFHAAAYKHVPLMEANPLEAVRNNTLVTRSVADVAVEFGAKRFVLVSTDKAVNAKTVMGQSKALCEWIVEAWGHRTDASTRFCGVRFGNVLGSSGSVIPIFRKQLARGRAADGDASRHDALLHDDPGGRAARHPGRRDRRARPGLRPRHGRAGRRSSTSRRR